MPICPRCQEFVEAGHRFCSSCGYRQLSGESEDQSTRILVVFANPTGSDSLRLGAEDRTIKEAFYKGKQRDKIGIDICHAATIHDMRRALLHADYRIMQFSGHSSGSEFLFEDYEGNAERIGFGVFSSFVAAHAPPLECVILNACSTLEQGRLLAFDVPYVIAMRASIQDKAAIEFSHGFYDAIAAGKSIEFAYQEGRRCMQMIASSEADLPILVRHTILDSYPKLPLGVRSIEYQRWHELLAAGKLELRLAPQATNEVNVLLSILDKVLREQRFRKDTIDRAAIILWELISNVARHVKDSPVVIGLEINTLYFPMVIISVADHGNGFEWDDILDNQYLRMKSGSPEHGLGRICRLSDEISRRMPREDSPYHTIFCSLYDIEPPQSIFDEFPWCARVTAVFENPYVVWFGRMHYPFWGQHGIACTFDFALEHGINELLDLYLKHLLLANPQYLCFEVTGSRSPTEGPPYIIPTLTKALEKYFATYFKQKRVIRLDGRGRAGHGIGYFTSVEECHRELEKLAGQLEKRS